MRGLKRWQSVKIRFIAPGLAVGVVLVTAAFTLAGSVAPARPGAATPAALRVPTPTRFQTMVSKTVGWGLSADNQVLRTTNGGKSWVIVSPAYRQINPLALSAMTTAQAVLIGVPIGGQPPIVWATRSAGRHWQMTRLTGALHATTATVDWESATRAWTLVTLAFSTNQKPPKGYPPAGAMGFENVLYRTTDGGARWSLVPSTTVPDQVSQMTFNTPSTGWMSLTTDAIGPNTPILAETVNAGRVWHMVTLPRPPLLVPRSANPKMDYAPFPVAGPTFANARTGAVLSTYGALNANGTSKPTYPVVYFTTNGGKRWQWILLPMEVSGNPTDVPTKVVWQPTKTGWLLNVLNSAGTVIAQWPVSA